MRYAALDIPDMPTATTTKSLAEVWGEGLRAARIRAGYTQVELAERIGQSQFTISRIENGEHRPHDDTKIALAGALDTTVEILFPYPHPSERGWQQ